MLCAVIATVLSCQMGTFSGRKNSDGYESRIRIQYPIDEKLTRIDLNRPDESNLRTEDMMVKFADAIRRLGAREDLYVIPIEGRGTVFCRDGDGGGGGQSAASLSPYHIRKRMMGPLILYGPSTVNLLLSRALVRSQILRLGSARRSARGTGPPIVNLRSISARSASRSSFPCRGTP